MPVVFAVRHYRADGSDVERARYDVWARGGRPLSETCPPSMSDAWPEEFHRADTDYVIVKPRFSAFFHTELDLILRRLGVDTAQAAEAHLKKQALYRSREGEILRLLDQPPRPLVEKEQKKVAAWTDMGFADEVLRLAYEKTVYKKQKMDWDYMNGILCGWHRKNLHTLAEVEAGDRQRRPAAQPAMQGRPAAPGEADQRVREDLERMREFLRRQQETEGE